MDSLIAAYDRVAEEYEDLYNTAPHDRAESELVFMRAEASRNGGTLLDIGCGPGIALHWLDGGKYLGVDPSPKMIEVASRSWPEREFRLGTIDTLPSERYGFVLGGFGPLCHIEDAEGFAREVARVLTGEGRYLVMAATRGFVRFTGEPRVTHTAGQLRSAFSQAGLAVKVSGLSWGANSLKITSWMPGRCEWLLVEGQKSKLLR